MKISRDAIRHARALFQASSRDGKVDVEKIRTVTKRIAETKPRGYLGILTALHRLVRLDLEKRHAVVESAVELPDPFKEEILANLKRQFGDDLTHDFRLVPNLLGGMRVRVGSHIWDGSVKTRLERLSRAFS